MQYKVISFYRYVQIKQPEQLRNQLKQYCQDHHILGRILIAQEGINGAVSGTVEEIISFQKYLQEISLHLTFREQETTENTYHKIVIRVRTEIVQFQIPVTFQHPGTHLAPQQLKQWYDTNEDFVIIDARNDYEYEVGRFKNAIKLPIQNFREFPETLSTLEQYKEKKIVLYCTGGIRCEKASAYLKEQGFPEVYQVEGGVINYVNQFPNTYWEGGLFVFDDRLVSDIGATITTCRHCHKPVQQYINCHNLDCDTLFISCKSCQTTMDSCCSTECQNAPRQRKKVFSLKPERIIGKIENYYPKANVALAKIIQNHLTLPILVTIKGKTTPAFDLNITSAYDNVGNSIQHISTEMSITFPLTTKVRKNDHLIISI